MTVTAGQSDPPADRTRGLIAGGGVRGSGRARRYTGQSSGASGSPSRSLRDGTQNIARSATLSSTI